MIHVQNWKIYTSYYSNDSTELGLFELRKAQLHFKQYGEQMGVPVTDDIVSRAKRPSVDDIFPFLFDGTSVHDYNQAQYFERNNNCITIREWQEREGTLKQAVEIITTGAEQTPVTTNADSDYVSPFKLQTGWVDDLYELLGVRAYP